MSAATLTCKGQITLPAAVRHAMKLDTGDRVEFVEVAAGRFECVALTRNATEIKGMFCRLCASSSAAKPISRIV